MSPPRPVRALLLLASVSFAAACGGERPVEGIVAVRSAHTTESGDPGHHPPSGRPPLPGSLKPRRPAGEPRAHRIDPPADRGLRERQRRYLEALKNPELFPAALSEQERTRRQGALKREILGF